MFTALFQSLGILRNPMKELPLDGMTFSEYKVSLIKSRAFLERQLHDSFRNKINIDKKSIVAEIEKINTLLVPVYDIQNARQKTLFPLS